MDNADLLSTSLGLLEKHEEVIYTLSEIVKSSITNPEVRTLAIESIHRLQEIHKILTNSFTPMDLDLSPTLLASQGYTSKIYKLGIAADIILAIQNGTSINELASIYGLAVSTIKRFVTHYDSLARVEQEKIRRQSVFNTTERLEELFVVINRQLCSLEGIDDKVHVQYVEQLRKVIEAATALTEKVTTVQAFNDFVQTVEDFLVGELPDKRNQIIQGIKSLQDNNLSNALSFNRRRL
jgi:intergrase/recombinase